MKKFHANRSGLEDMADMVRAGSVLAHEPLKNVKAFWGELVNTAFLEGVG